MRYSIDTYPLYKDEKRFAFVVRAKVRMKEPVDIDILRTAANKAIKRYPYFAKKVEGLLKIIKFLLFRYSAVTPSPGTSLPEKLPS